MFSVSYYSPVVHQVPSKGNLGEDPATAVKVELAKRQAFPRRVDQTRERAHADERKR